MSQPSPATGVLIILGVWSVIAVLAACGTLNFPSPPKWFEDWSKLFATVAVAAIGARVLWVAPKQIQTFLDRTKS